MLAQPQATPRPSLVTFEPSAERGAALDRQMRTRLAESLRYLFSQTGELLGVPSGAASALLQRIAGQPQSPHLFGAYYDLVLALHRQDPESARAYAEELLTIEDEARARLVALQDLPANRAQRCRRIFIADPERVQAADDIVVRESRRLTENALELLGLGFPELKAEIDSLIRDIVIAADRDDGRDTSFESASSYMLWGAIMVNARRQETVLDTVQVLAHESGHNVLFGYCVNGPLVTNGDEKLYPSPLRSDLRSMDAVVHATYVIACMHQSLHRLLEAGVLDNEQIRAARDYLVIHRRNFERGDHVILDHAKLTEVGQKVTASAREYMRIT